MFNINDYSEYKRKAFDLSDHNDPLSEVESYLSSWGHFTDFTNQDEIFSRKEKREAKILFDSLHLLTMEEITLLKCKYETSIDKPLITDDELARLYCIPLIELKEIMQGVLYKYYCYYKKEEENYREKPIKVANKYSKGAAKKSRYYLLKWAYFEKNITSLTVREEQQAKVLFSALQKISVEERNFLAQKYRYVDDEGNTKTDEAIAEENNMELIHYRSSKTEILRGLYKYIAEAEAEFTDRDLFKEINLL